MLQKINVLPHYTNKSAEIETLTAMETIGETFN